MKRLFSPHIQSIQPNPAKELRRAKATRRETRGPIEGRTNVHTNVLQLSRQVKLQIYECQKGSLPRCPPPSHSLLAIRLPRSPIVLVLARGDGNIKTHKYVKSQTRSQSQKCCDSAWHQLTHTHTGNFLIKKQSSTRRQEGQSCCKTSVFLPTEARAKPSGQDAN